MEKYENLGLVGEGSYGMVMKCRHRESSQLVAIKKFLETENDKMVKKIAMREVKLLKQLRHENLVNLIEVFRRKKRLFLVFEFVDRTALDDLEKFPTGADENYVKKVMWQVLRGIDFCHSHNVLHRDIKPENILISKRGVVKICDFGFARLIAPPGEAYTDYVATRWYRSPELLVGDTNYGKAVDVWAVGCLFSEMLTGEPLFPGESDIDQLFLITKCFGNLIAKHREVFSRNPLFIGMRLPEARELDPLERRYPRLSSASMDIIKWSLRLDPNDRPTCTQLLRHELFQRNSWADKYSSELRSKIQQELEENPLLKKLMANSESRHPPANPPRIREPIHNGRPPIDRLSVLPGGGGFSSGTEAMYSGTEEMGSFHKKEKKKKKKEPVLQREKAHHDLLILKPPQSPHTIGASGMGMGLGPPQSPRGSMASLHKPSTPLHNPILHKPPTPRTLKNYNLPQDIPAPLLMRQHSNNPQNLHSHPTTFSHPMMPPPQDSQLPTYSRLRDLHSTSNASIASQHEVRSDIHAPRMEIPQNLLGYGNSSISPSHPPPYKKYPSNVGLPQLSTDPYTSNSLVAKTPVMPSQPSYQQYHTHIPQNDASGHHMVGSGSQLTRGNGYLGGITMEPPPASPSRLRRAQENSQQGYHLIPYS